MCNNKSFTKKEAIEAIEKQFKKHPDCLNTIDKWDSYEDKPFALYHIKKYIGWKKIKVHFGKPLKASVLINLLMPLFSKFDNERVNKLFKLVCLPDKINNYLSVKRLDHHLMKKLKENKKYTSEEMKWAKITLNNLVEEWKKQMNEEIVL